MGQGLLLGLVEIFEQCARRNHAAAKICKSQPLQTGDLKMIQQSLLTELVVKIPGLQGLGLTDFGCGMIAAGALLKYL